MSQILLDLGVTQNAINLGKAKARDQLNANLEARKARQEANGMKDGFDFSKVEGIAVNELLEKRAKANAEDAAQAAAQTAPTPAPEVKAEPVVEELKAEATLEAPAEAPKV